MARLLSQYIPPGQHSPLGYIMPQERPVPAVVSWQEGNVRNINLIICLIQAVLIQLLYQ